MKKNLISVIAIVLILVVSSLGFAGCGKKDDKKDDTVVPATTTSENDAANVAENGDDEDVVYETVYVMVTDKNGQPKTNDKNEAITEVSKVKKTKANKNTKKTKKAAKTQEVKGGTDPYVEDPF